jgi:hypothetical protein
MGLRQTISEWVKSVKDALDLGPEFPAAMEGRRVLFAQESARLQHLLEQTRKASQEKDELIAKLRTAGAVTGNMVVDGPAYYIRRANTLEGPFCTSCFQRHHEIMRIVSAPQLKGADETPANRVQCGRCMTPFRSDRISQYLDPGQGTGPDDRGQTSEDRRQKTELQSHPSSVLLPAVSDQEPKPTLVRTAVPPEENDAPKPVKAARKPRRDPKRDESRLGAQPRTRKPKDQRPERTKTADCPEST